MENKNKCDITESYINSLLNEFTPEGYVNLYKNDFTQNFQDKNVDLNEASLGRIYKHIQKKNVKSWAILTSYRNELSPSENNNNFRDLKNKVRSMDLGFIPLQGIGQEEDLEGDVTQVREPSLFIPNITKKSAQKLSDIYNQWGYIYSGPEVNEKIVLVSENGKTEESIGVFHPNKIAQFFSKIKGKPFTFESAGPTSNMERWYKYLQSKNI